MRAEHVVRHPAARWRRCVDGIVVMAPDAREPVFLPAPGDAIWILLATPRTVDELVDELSAQYEEGRAIIAHDVAAFLAQLDRTGLVGR